MDIKDISGIGELSKPIVRFIEVVASGLGNVSAPLLRKWNADALLHESQKLKQALGELSSIDNLRITYCGGQLEVEKEPTLTTGLVSGSDPSTAERICFQERRRQHNIEQITSNAVMELTGTADVPEQKPLDDWVTRFFSIAQDISAQEMQILWGRILSGEVKKPGSYSMRTLDIVRNLSNDEAQAFERVARFAVETSGRDQIVPDGCRKWLEKNRSLRYIDFVLLGEIGLMYPNPVKFIPCMSEPPEPAILTSGTIALIVDRAENEIDKGIPAYRFTKSGNELIALTEGASDKEYMLAVGSELVRVNFKVQIGDIAERNHDGVTVVHSQIVEATESTD
jgi:hypothetical protein